MLALLSTTSNRCPRYEPGRHLRAVSEAKNAPQFDANRDLTPQTVIAPLIAIGSMLGRWQARQHASRVSGSLQAQHFTGDSAFGGTLSEGIA